jgi:ABC-type Zn uptake system ZnuABC Zn-binding protein ZnuA
MATVAPIADLVERVLGEQGAVRSVVPHGADSHTFEPSPGQARALAEADVFFGNGLHLNDAVLRLAGANLADGVPLVLLAEDVLAEDERLSDEWLGDGDDHGHTHGEEDEGGEANPHAWMDPLIGQRYVERIAEVLSEVDPEGARVYEDNATAELARIQRLHEATEEAVATIPEAQRTLVTFHDGLSYWADRYGLELVAVVQPSDFSEPSARGVREVMDIVRDSRSPAVFGSEVFPSDVLAVIAEETGATYVGDLSDDTLPDEPDDDRRSYVGMVAANAALIVEGLGGDAGALEALFSA